MLAESQVRFLIKRIPLVIFIFKPLFQGAVEFIDGQKEKGEIQSNYLYFTL